MTVSRNETHAAPSVASPILPFLILLFIGSGCAALIYEVVWLQLLELVLGVSGVSLGVLLATFMGGMFIGSLLAPRFIRPDAHPLRVYAYLELGIAIFGLLILYLLPSLSNLYASLASPGLFGLLLRSLLGAICLLPPTILMGATLPAIGRWVEATPTGVSWLGFFYGGNTAGAVVGCLLAGFYLLRVFDMAVATWVAVGINLLVAGVALWIATLVPAVKAEKLPESDVEPAAVPGTRLVYLAIGISGLAALGSEVIWTRLLSLLLGGTTYTFSLILGVMLAGIGLGSSIGAWLARVSSDPRKLLGWAQLSIPVALGWSAYAILGSLPHWPVSPDLSSNPWIYFQFDMVRTFFAVFPATLLWGLSFPLAVAAVASPGQDTGALVGRVYAANTLGAIIGAAGVALFGIPTLGSHGSQQLLAFLPLIAGVLLLLFRPAGATTPLAGARVIGAGIAAAVAVVIARDMPQVPPGLIGYGRFLPTFSSLPEFLQVAEGRSSSIAVSRQPSGYISFHVSGKVEASSEPQDMRLQRMLGHISALAQGNPKSVLIVGFGAGVTAGTFTLYPGIERIVICELEPLVPKVIGPYFTEQNYNIINDPRVEFVYDDARHYILTTREKFDIITSDPIHPWVKGAATLYTQEYLDLARRHLNPGGVMTEWVPLYESHADAVKSQMATFFKVYPNGTAWANNTGGRGYDMVMLAKDGPLTIDVPATEAFLSRPDAAEIRESLGEVGIFSLLDLFGNYAGQPSDLGPWLADAQINRDLNLRLQFLAGLANNVYENAEIYSDFASYRRFPSQLFNASDDWKNDLATRLGMMPEY